MTISDWGFRGMLLAVMAVLGGCVAPALPPPKNLSPVTSASSFLLSKPVTYDFSNVFGDHVRHTVSPGLYTALLEGADGIYYVGPGECLRYDPSGPSFAAGVFSTQVCGVFLPFDEAAPPRVFFRMKSAVQAQDPPGLSQTQVNVIGSNAGASVMQTSVAAGVTMGVINAMIASNAEEFMKTNVCFDDPQPPVNQLREAIGPIKC